MKLKFLGATETVTGSKYWLQDGGRSFLVDCGLFQGRKELRLRNWEGPPVDPREVQCVLLTHAHLDHSGYLPLFVKKGFKGPIYATRATADLCGILLRDAGRIQEEDARRANKYGYTKHKPALPLYTEEDAIDSLKLLKTIELGTEYPLGEGVSFHASRAGHILGSAILTIRLENGESLVFSGDLGRPHHPIIKPPATIQQADYLVLESTYGERLHPREEVEEKLGQIVRQTVSRGGTLLIPSFAVGRTQMVLYYLYRLLDRGEIPPVPIYLDSPMAQDATDILKRYRKELRIPPELCSEVCHLAHYIQTVEESKWLHSQKVPQIILSASGMLEGGRVLHHVKHYAPNHLNTILFVGFQAPMTRGDRIIGGAREVKIHGQMVPIRAQIEEIEGLSSHADYEEMLEWLKRFRERPKMVFLTHGEKAAAEHLKEVIEKELGWNVFIPAYLEEVVL